MRIVPREKQAGEIGPRSCDFLAGGKRSPRKRLDDAERAFADALSANGRKVFVYAIHTRVRKCKCKCRAEQRNVNVKIALGGFRAFARGRARGLR